MDTTDNPAPLPPPFTLAEQDTLEHFDRFIDCARQCDGPGRDRMMAELRLRLVAAELELPWLRSLRQPLAIVGGAIVGGAIVGQPEHR